MLCADDYAISEGVSRAMLALIDAGRLTAVSAMAAAPGWPEQAADLKARRGAAAIGLHFDLTLRPFAGKAPRFGLRDLVARALLRRLDVAALAAEFERQLDRFETALGAAPDHVDGHHHVHALPQVRDAVLGALSRRYGARPGALRPLVRAPEDAPLRIARRRAGRGKALTVAALCAGFGRRASAAGFATNLGFAGFSRFGGRAAFERELDAFVTAPGPRHLVMCHPGFSSAELTQLDPLSDARDGEYAALMERDDVARPMMRVARERDAPAGAFAAWSTPK